METSPISEQGNGTHPSEARPETADCTSHLVRAATTSKTELPATPKQVSSSSKSKKDIPTKRRKNIQIQEAENKQQFKKKTKLWFKTNMKGKRKTTLEERAKKRKVKTK